jgi:DNA-directed RNA polymerase specialized sigma24 family protein
MTWYDEPTWGRYAALQTHLTEAQEERALALFRAGQDTVDIAKQMHCTQAAVHNGMGRVRARQHQARHGHGETQSPRG